MRPSKENNYRSDLAELDQYRMSIKQEACPHCQATGYLIGHGFLKGYRDKNDQKEIRGRRFFCSNRNRRNGCGHTFSVLLADLLKYFMAPAAMLWVFLKGVRAGLTRKAAWERLTSSFSLETAYRLWNRFRQAQSYIRTHLLHHHGDPPSASNTTEPLFELIDHLIAAFPRSSCPIAAFQERLQRPLLP